MDKSRFKNYGLWLSVAALIPMLLKGFGINILPDNYDQIITAILSILVMAGILNNPTTDAKWYLDDGKVEEVKPAEIEMPLNDDSVTTETVAKENSEGK